MKKTLTLVALASVITFSALAKETPVMTLNEAESTKIEQQIEHQDRNENKLGAQSGSGSQIRTQTQTRTGMENMQPYPKMQNQMQNQSRMGGGHSH